MCLIYRWIREQINAAQASRPAEAFHQEFCWSDGGGGGALVNLAGLVDRSTDSWGNERAARINKEFVSIILVFPTERSKNNKRRLFHWLRGDYL